ncbi:unnamed protein product [Schistocephalus solidus]|uniref:Transmembrane protein n=1 Tax=Schistocephalus solidus TaxID=70667 RepID=A0A183T103_SCHSO|nr:unnamed protein product [Schistocephalus solidus]
MLGLWEACFNNFIFAEDYISKAYSGCWYIYRDEFKYIRFWLVPIGCLTVITTYVGIMSKDREWMPYSDRNTVSWGFAFTATAGVLTLLSIFCLVVDQLADYSERIYQKLLFERGLIPLTGEPSGAASIAYGLGPGSGFEIGPASRCGQESRTGVPSLFLTGSVPSAGQFGAPPGRLSSLLGGPSRKTPGTSALGTRSSAFHGESGVSIPILGRKAEVQGTSGAVASAKLREQLQTQRPPASGYGETGIMAGGAGDGGSMVSLSHVPLTSAGLTAPENTVLYAAGGRRAPITHDSAV